LTNIQKACTDKPPQTPNGNRRPQLWYDRQTYRMV